MDIIAIMPYVTAIVANLTPVISAFISGYFNYLMHKNTISLPEKLKAINTMTTVYMSYKGTPSDRFTRGSFLHSIDVLIPLCRKKKTRTLLFLLANHIKTNGLSNETDILYQEAILQLSKEL